MILPAAEWLAAENMIVSFRHRLNASDGIMVTKELHATDFVAGRGNLGSVVTKWRRARIFEEALTFVAALPGVAVVNACLARSSEDLAFERLVNHLDAFALDRDDHIILISDQGKDYTPLLRRMRRQDAVKRVVEDIVYRDSKHSTFIQLADFCAFALLRFENPTGRLQKAGLHRAFQRLEPALLPQSFRNDPKSLGIIREP